MKIQFLQRNQLLSTLRKDVHSVSSPISPQVASKLNQGSQEFILKLLDRRWTLISPDTKIHQVMVRQPGCVFGKFSFSNNAHPSIGESMIEKNIHQPSFYIVRDDLLHPLVNGNKARKLDALLPLVEDHSVTDVVTCGGCQSAHTAAVAVSCAERGLKSHLLLRGEQPQILTGYNLISMLYGNVTYVPRSLYSKREEMLAKHAGSIADGRDSIISLDDLLEYSFSNYASIKSNIEELDDRLQENVKKIVIVSEGAGDAVALLGVIRLVQYLSQTHLLGKQQPFNIVVDAGTGTTAVGLAIGALCLGLPWGVTALMLADDIDGYKEQEKRLVSEFCQCSSMPFINQIVNGVDGGIVHWVERDRRRKFGNVLEGEVEACQQIAQQTGVLVDPIYTLAAWELATQLSLEEREGGAKIVMIHTGGTLGMFGIAQSIGVRDFPWPLQRSKKGAFDVTVKLTSMFRFV